MNRTLPLLVAASLLAVGMAAADHTQTQDGHDVRFDHKTGNEWWVEVLVSPQPAQVHARDTDGDWRALTLRDWGAWAASFHIEPGHEVWFRATFADGTTIESCAFTHPQGVEQCEPTPPPPPPPGDYTFDHKTGNEWWVEVLISPKPVAAQAMDTGGAWKTLTFRDWGAWAASFHLEAGHDVRFRAQDASGAWHESCWFTHPRGVETCDDTPPPPPPPPSEFDATFSDASGNEWWVQVDVDANEPLASVHARVVDGTWHALTKRSWGAWAASFHVEDGALVEFRATSTDGDVDLSDSYYRWPDATPVARSDDDLWPQEGSFVTYRVSRGQNIGQYADDTSMDVAFTWSDGRWQAHCVGTTTFSDFGGGDPRPDEHFDFYVHQAPPIGETDVEVGGEAWVDQESFCHMWDLTIPVTEATTIESTKNGETVTVDVWKGFEDEQGSCGCGELTIYWHQDTGLAVLYDYWTVNAEYYLEIVDTDAPIAQDDAAPSPPTPPAWPSEGSFVEYEVREWYNGSMPAREEATLRFEYRDGAWSWTCTQVRDEADGSHDVSVTVGPNRSHAWSGEDFPWMGPLDVEAGDHVKVTGARCQQPTQTFDLRGTFPERSTREGASHTATVWWGDELPEDDADGTDNDVWYDVDTGLVLRWEQRTWSGTMERVGWLVDTDAPLSSG